MEPPFSDGLLEANEQTNMLQQLPIKLWQQM